MRLFAFGGKKKKKSKSKPKLLIIKESSLHPKRQTVLVITENLSTTCFSKEELFNCLDTSLSPSVFLPKRFTFKQQIAGQVRKTPLTCSVESVSVIPRPALSQLAVLSQLLLSALTFVYVVS